MAKSTDGGETFTNFKVSESPFTPNPSTFFGDYTNVSAANNIVRPIWARLDNSILSIYTAIVDFKTNIQLVSANIPSSLKLYDNYPNPFNSITKIKFDVSEDINSNIKLTIYDSNGKEVEKLVDKHLSPGTYEVEWNGLNFASGTYYYKLESADFTETKMFVLIK
jgi:hypothetical protein